MLRVERIGNLSQLESIRDSWVELLAGCSYGNIFLTHEWITSWWSHFGEGKALWILLVKDGDKIIGIAPMMVGHEWYNSVPVRMLGFLMNKHTSRADFIIPERKEIVIKALVNYFRETSGSWDVLRLVHMPKDSGNMEVIEQELKNSSMICFPVETSRILFYLPLTYTWDNYLKSRSQKFRRNINQSRNGLEKTGNFEFIIETGTAGDADESMERVFSLEQLSWKGRADDVRFSDADVRFHKDLARKFAKLGGLDNRFLSVNGRLVAVCHQLIHNRTAYWFLIYHDESFSHISLGRNILVYILKEYMEAGHLKEVDINGKSAWIRHWSSQYRTFETISVCNTRIYSRLIAGLMGIKRVYNKIKKKKSEVIYGQEKEGA